VRCYKCQLEEDGTNTSRGREQKTDASRKRAAVTLEGSTLRSSERVKGQERVDYHEHSWERDIQNDRGYSESIEQLSYGLKMRAADPRYITTGDDSNRGDVLLTMAQVRELITKKDQSEEGIATVWLTITEMGFSLTDEPNAIECTKDVRDGKVSDRYLAPAISRFAIEILANVATGADMDQQAKDVRRKLVNLYQRWGKVHKIPDNEDIRAQACNEAKASSRFTRIVQRKDLPWEKDSIARVAHDPEHIPDCNVQALVGRHFLFHEPIPKAANGRGYLRVATKSLWWQHEHFPKVWTSEGLTTCMENGYQWTINSTTTDVEPSPNDVASTASRSIEANTCGNASPEYS
jgi:hypothetical protein